VSDNGYFFQADTIEELAENIEAGHEFQRVPLKHLTETLATWNDYLRLEVRELWGNTGGSILRSGLAPPPKNNGPYRPVFLEDGVGSNPPFSIIAVR
jgi:hypothetical protein